MEQPKEGVSVKGKLAKDQAAIIETYSSSEQFENPIELTMPNHRVYQFDLIGSVDLSGTEYLIVSRDVDQDSIIFFVFKNPKGTANPPIFIPEGKIVRRIYRTFMKEHEKDYVFIDEVKMQPTLQQHKGNQLHSKPDEDIEVEYIGKWLLGEDEGNIEKWLICPKEVEEVAGEQNCTEELTVACRSQYKHERVLEEENLRIGKLERESNNILMEDSNVGFRIICPYCFEEMSDEQVLFRSEKINKDQEPDMIPDDYEDIEDFVARYRGADRERILQEYHRWEFFSETDPFADASNPYKLFWERFDGTTTEEDSNDQYLGVASYRRPIIDPAKSEHQRFLKKQSDGSYFIRNQSGMVTQIELTSGERCNRRVCCHCHNPLPDGYGRNETKFVTLVGVTGAGKTVYLSQLLRKMVDYAANVGLDAIVTNVGVTTFLKKNAIAAQKPLPGSTPFKQFQQPLFYEIVRRTPSGERVTETLVMYDVAGELFQSGGAANVEQFAPFIKHANGIIVLVDPMQIEAISDADPDAEAKSPAVTALNAIHTIVTDGCTDNGCEVPVAICLSQIDKASVQAVLDEELRRMLNSNVSPVFDQKQDPMPVFNAQQHLPIAERLKSFMQRNQRALYNRMNLSYADHNYFAFTALGCDVVDGKPVGPVIPKRIEEPVQWLFYKLGYIQTNEVFLPECPECGSKETYELPADERVIRVGLLKRKQNVFYGCKSCEHKW